MPRIPFPDKLELPNTEIDKVEFTYYVYGEKEQPDESPQVPLNQLFPKIKLEISRSSFSKKQSFQNMSMKIVVTIEMVYQGKMFTTCEHFSSGKLVEYTEMEMIDNYLTFKIKYLHMILITKYLENRL